MCFGRPATSAVDALRRQRLAQVRLDLLRCSARGRCACRRAGARSLVGLRLEVAERQVLQLPLQLPDAEAVGQRRMDVAGQLRQRAALRPRAVRGQAQAREVPRQQDRHHAQVAHDRQQQAAQAFAVAACRVVRRAASTPARRRAGLRAGRRLRGIRAPGARPAAPAAPATRAGARRRRRRRRHPAAPARPACRRAPPAHRGAPANGSPSPSCIASRSASGIASAGGSASSDGQSDGNCAAHVDDDFAEWRLNSSRAAPAATTVAVTPVQPVPQLCQARGESLGRYARHARRVPARTATRAVPPVPSAAPASRV